MKITINDLALYSTRPNSMDEQLADFERHFEEEVMGEETYDFEEIDEEVMECFAHAFDEGIIHPGEYGDVWIVWV